MKPLLRCIPLLAAIGLASCGGDVGIGVGVVWHDHPWPNHPDWPSWPDHPQGATGLYPIAGDVCGVCSGSKDGTGPAARFKAPEGIVADSAGNLYVAEPASATIRKLTPQGVVTTLAGASNAVGYADGNGGAARFNQPTRIETDTAGNLYVTDTGNSVVRKLTASGTVLTLAGNGTCGSSDGNSTSAQFCNPKGIALDRWGNLWIADTGNHTVRRIDPSGKVSTVAGAPGVCGSANGRGDVARFCNPQDVGVDEWGNVYVVDTGNSTIRMISAKGEVSTLAGQAGQCGSVDGSTSVSRLCAPSGIAVEGNDLYIADTGNATVRRINLDNVTSTVAGVPGQQGIVLGALPGGLDRPIGIARAPDGSFALTTHNIVVKLLAAK
ncbi:MULTISPECIES: alkaline phosphatase PhoX [unclassified Massilia]|uniref:alkaline phosphatase PhoX n=1 Tax=unclassified Massilia TaxID=2609279 RepID=UPI000A66248B|nr:MULTISPECIES: alkaline phosphatase PhoX [unclassified Massilia]